MTPRTVDATLTRAEREASFRIPEPEFEPIQKPTRLALEWENLTFAEIDPATGQVVAVGEVGA
jgi:hypothetical protein